MLDVKNIEEFDKETEVKETSFTIEIKNLPLYITDLELMAYAEPWGKVKSCIVAPHKSGKSKGVGFVTYESEADCKKAVSNLNNSKICKTVITCGICQSKVSDDKGISRTLIIKNVPSDYSKDDLFSAFSGFGKIEKYNISVDKGDLSLIAFLTYEKEKNAHSALEKMNNKRVTEEEQFFYDIKFAKHFETSNYVKNQEAMKEQLYQGQMVYSPPPPFVSNLNPDGNGYYPMNHYGSYHPAPSPPPFMDHYGYQNGYFNGYYGPYNYNYDFGYYDVSPPCSPPCSPMPLPYHYQPINALLTPPLSPKRSNSHYERKKFKKGKDLLKPNLFVFHLPQTIDDNGFFELFCPYGEVKSLKVIRNKSGSSRGYGFVLYSSFDEANRAIKHMDGKKVENKYLKVSFKTRRVHDEKGK